MEDFDLRDLVLAGVKWEVTDMPMALSSIARVAFVADKKEDIKNRDSAVDKSNSNRTHTSIVPPIAPQQAMSVETAAAMAARPVDMDSLCRMISEFNHPLRSGATNVVLPQVGKSLKGLVIVTDVPGADDDATGNILSGAAGELMDKMLSAIGMLRDNVAIIPLVFWRTPGGRSPTREELDLARPFVNRCFGLLKPKLMLTLGTLSASEIANVNLPRNHGVPVELASGTTVVPIYHPNYLILKPTAKRDAWTALQLVQNLLKSADK